jgi:hypothetical protein
MRRILKVFLLAAAGSLAGALLGYLGQCVGGS